MMDLRSMFCKFSLLRENESYEVCSKSLEPYFDFIFYSVQLYKKVNYEFVLNVQIR